MHPVVTVLGAGNGGKATAADLSLRGFDVRLYDHYPAALTDVQAAGGIELHGSGVSGFATIATATSNLAEAVSGADILIVVTPAVAHDRVIENLCPLLTDGQTVLFTPGYLGSVLLRHRLKAARPGLKVKIAETCSLPYACRQIGPAVVGLRGIKQVLDMAALPAEETPEVLAQLLPLFPALVPAKNVLEVALSNPNPVSHVPTSILNFRHMDAPRPSEWHDFEEWVSPRIHRFQQKVDRERLAVMAALGLQGIDIDQWSHRAYGGRAKEPLKVTGEIPPNAVAVPDRYITEDVPMGLVPLEGLGRLTGVPTPLATLLISMASELFDRDYRVEGRNLDSLGWANLRPNQLLEQVTR